MCIYSFLRISDARSGLEVPRITSTLSGETVPEQQFRQLMKEQRDGGGLQQHSGVGGNSAARPHATSGMQPPEAAERRGSYRSRCFLVPSSLMARSMESKGTKSMTHETERS